MVLVREDQQAAFDALTLQGGEGRQALGRGDAEIQIALDDQHRRVPLVDVVGRVEFLIAARIFPRGAAVLPLGEPELLRRKAHGEGVEDAVVVDQAFEGIRPVSGDPVDHIAAVGRPERAGAVTVEEAIGPQGVGPALLQVLQRAIAPVLADRVGEGLAVTDRAVEIDHHHRIAGPGIGLGVPAPGPVVAEGALRPAVDQEGDRIFFARDIVGGLDHPGVDGFVVPALEGELLGLAEGKLAEDRIDLGQAARHFAAAIRLEPEVTRLIQGGQRIDDARRRQAAGGDRTLAGEGDDHAVAGIDREHPVVAGVLGGDIEGVAVRTPGQAAGRAVPIGGDLADLTGFHVAQHDAELVRLEARAGHGAIRQGATVGREDRTGIPGGIAVGQIGEGAAVTEAVSQPQVEVGAPRLARAGLARREHQRPSVGGEGKVLFAAERLGGGVAVKTARHPDGVALGPAIGAQRDDEQMVLGAVLPGVPVADEHAVIDATGAAAGGFSLGPFDRTGQRLAVRIDGQRHDQSLAVGRDLVALDIKWQVGDLDLFGALGVGGPDLVRAGA